MKKSLLALVLGSALALTACDQAQKTAEKAQAAATEKAAEVKETAVQKAEEILLEESKLNKEGYYQIAEMYRHISIEEAMKKYELAYEKGVAKAANNKNAVAMFSAGEIAFELGEEKLGKYWYNRILAEPGIENLTSQILKNING